MRGGVPGPLHPRTREAFAEVAAAGGKAILLINRRGWSTHLTCRSCGHAWECPNCDVSLILHRDGALRCHHCGHAEPRPEACPECSSVTIARVGLRHPAGRGRALRAAGAARGLPPRLRQRRRARPRGGSPALRGRRLGGPGRHPDGRQGPRLPRRHPERRPRRRRRAAPAGLPLRGAHLRADHPARRPQRAGRGRREGPGSGAGDRRAEHPPRREARLGWVPRRGARAAAGPALSALLAPDRGRTGR